MTMKDYMNLAPTPTTVLMESTTLADSACTTGQAGTNFVCGNNNVGRACFTTSFIFGTTGPICSGSEASGGLGIPALGGARVFNRLGKYTLYVGNITNGNITNSTEIAELLN